MDGRSLAAWTLALGFVFSPFVPAQASNPYANQSILWSRDQYDFGRQAVISAVSGDTIAVFDWGPDGGSIFIFQFISGAWTEIARLTPDNASVATGLGIGAIAISDDGSFVAADMGGAIDVFQRPSSGWQDMSESAVLTDSASNFFSFDTSIAANGVDIAIAVRRSGGASSVVDIYAKPASGWEDTSTPSAIMSTSASDAMSFTDEPLGFSDDALAVPGDSSGLPLRASIYDEPAGGWVSHSPSYQAYPPTSALTSVDGFALSADTLVFAAEGCSLSGCNVGSVAGLYVFQKPNWQTLVATLTPSDNTIIGSYDLVSSSAGLILYGYSDGSNDKGTVYGFLKPGTGWANANEDFSFSLPSGDPFPLRQVANTDSTLLVSMRGQTCPAGVTPSEQGTGASFMCPVVYAFDTGAIVSQTADVLASPSMVGKAAVIKKPFSVDFSVKNTGTADAVGTEAVIALPSEFTGAKFTASQGSCQLQTGKALCLLGTVPASASAGIVFSAVAPATGQTLDQSITVTTSTPSRSVRDGRKTVAIRVDTPPVAKDISLILTDGDGISVTPFQATDADGDPLTYRIVTKPQHIQAAVVAAALQTQEQGDYTGTDSLTYVANDGVTDSNVATVNVTVQPAPPTVPVVHAGKGAFGLLSLAFLGLSFALRRIGQASRRSL